MKFDRQYGGKTISTWRTAAVLKIDRPPYIAISQWKIIQFSWNCVHISSRFWTGWTSRCACSKWRSCIGQTSSSTERISCMVICWWNVCGVVTYLWPHATHKTGRQKLLTINDDFSYLLTVGPTLRCATPEECRKGRLIIAQPNTAECNRVS